jgi:membrane protease YdiL (CAAX protease family)
MTSSIAQEFDSAEKRPESSWAITLEIALIFLPFYLGLVLSQRLGSNFVSLGGDLVLRQGLLAYVGLAVSLLVFWMAAKRRGVGWREFGVFRPKNWLLTIGQSLIIAFVVLGVVVLLINPAVKAIPGLAQQDLSSFTFLEGNLPNLIIQLVVVWVTAAFLEELLFRGYLMNRLVDLLGNPTRVAWLLAVVGQAIIFGLVHSQQGPGGILKVGMIGLVFGFAFLATKRNLWALVIAHGLIDSLDMITHYMGG